MPFKMKKMLELQMSPDVSQ